LSEAFQRQKGRGLTGAQILRLREHSNLKVEFEKIQIACDEAATLWMTEKAKRIAEKISLHFPGMVGDHVGCRN